MRTTVFVLIALFLSAAPAILYAQEEAPAFEWESIGPDNMGGRTRALAFTPSGDKLYAGACGGGLWVSENTGRTWRKVESFADIEAPGQASLSVSSIAIDPDNPNNIYVGTGEIALNFNKRNFSNYIFNSFNGSGFGYLGYSGIPGKGVIVSTDGGQTWSNDNATWAAEFRGNPYQVIDPESGEIVNPWLSVQKVTVSGGRVFAATINGLFYSDDNFASVQTPVENYGVGGVEEDEWLINSTILDIETAPGGAVYVATDKRVFISRDNGATFSEWVEGLDFPRNSDDEVRTFALSRLEVAVSASDPNVIYVAELTDEALNGVWRSGDAGATWTSVAPPSSYFQSSTNLSFAPTQYQGGTIGSYTFTLHVDRNDPDHIYMGSVQWWEYTPDRGWRNTTTNFEFIPWNQNYVPRNQHIVVNHPAQEQTILIGTDRQICSSQDGGETYKVATGLYSASSAYSVDVTLSGQIVASTANAGVVLKENTGTRSFRILEDDDEGAIRASYFNPEHFLSSSSQYDIERSLNDGEDFTDFLTDNRGEIIGTPDGGLNPDSCAREKLSPYPVATEALSEQSAGPQNYPITQFVLDPYSENEGDDVLRNRDNEPTKRGYAYHAYDNAVYVSFNPFGETDAERYMLPVTPTSFFDNAGSPPNRVSALAVSGDADHVLYIGTTNGKLFRVFNAHNPCSEDFAFVEINTSNMPQRWITSITFMPGRADTMVVTYGGYDALSDYFLEGDFRPAMVLATFNAKGDNPEFYNQHGFSLPSMPIYSAFFNPESPEDWMLLGTEEGVWYMNASSLTDDEEDAANIDYFPANDGEMFAVPVYDFAYHGWGYATDSVVYVKRAPNGNEVIDEDSSFILRVRAKSSSTREENVGSIGDTTIVLRHNVMLPPAVEQNIGNIYIATFGLGIFRSEIANFNNKVTGRSPSIDDGRFLTIYPNPANDKAKIRLDQPLSGPATARLFSIDGREITSWAFDGEGQRYAELDLQDVAAGAYFVKFTADQNGRSINSVGKLVITRR